MKIAVLSGKGGTGKTFVSVNLAVSVKNSVYADCDVEEPNGRLFLSGEVSEKKEVCVALPRFDKEKCIGCRKCVDFCSFNALAFIKNLPKVFSEVCHSCGGCMLVCESGAVSEENMPVGIVEKGDSHGVRVITGEMNVGEASGVPVIRRTLKEAFGLNAPLTVIDCPPGSACTVTESISEADYCLMVAEPTLFGLHNLSMVVRLAKTVGKPCGIIINKDTDGFPELENFCKRENLEIVARIPYKREYAFLISSGKLLIEECDEVKEIFCDLLRKIGGAV